jgi:putative ABC transport system permease protein
MKFIDIIKIAFSSLFRQKLRTLLTIFSIVIGSALISLVYAVIPGFEKFFNLQFNTLNSRSMIEVYPSSERPGMNILGGIGKAPEEYEEGDGTGSFDWSMGSFKDADIEKIEEIKGVKGVYESIFPNVDYAEFIDYNKKLKAGFVFYYPSFILKNIDLVAGRHLEENDTGKVLIANQYLESLGVNDPNELIGKKIYLHASQVKLSQINILSESDVSGDEEPFGKDFEFEIIGVTEKTIISTAIFITFEDGVDIVKFIKNTEEVLTDNDETRQYVAVEIEDENNAQEVKEDIEKLGFSANTFEDQQNILNDMFNVITIIFSSFGVLAMAVSSLGIVNTLIMAVMERTREIGVMKAIGARKISIAMMFTIEAALIGLFGGLIGLGLGLGLSEILDIISHKTFLSAFETLDLSNYTSLLALGPVISIVVSTIAGIYPAVRASRLDPVEALRYE